MENRKGEEFNKMVYLRESSEDEMILEFLKGEIKSERFQNEIFEVLKKLEVSVDLIEKADLNRIDENLKRKEIMRSFRGYGGNIHLFKNFPDIIRWIFAECTKEDINCIRYINYSYWNE